jgi:hypothetical protein
MIFPDRVQVSLTLSNPILHREHPVVTAQKLTGVLVVVYPDNDPIPALVYKHLYDGCIARYGGTVPSVTAPEYLRQG